MPFLRGNTLLNSFMPFVCAFFVGAGATAQSNDSHGDHPEPTLDRIKVVIDENPFYGALQTLNFDLIDLEHDRKITDGDLEPHHTKLIHLLVYDTYADRFWHVHPIYDPALSKWTTEEELEIPFNGTYFATAEGLLVEAKDGQIHRTPFQGTSGSFHVEGGLPEGAVKRPEDRTREPFAQNGQLYAELKVDQSTSKLRLDLLSLDGQPVQIEPWLGAFAHFVIFPQDGGLVHGHSMTYDQKQCGESSRYPCLVFNSRLSHRATHGLARVWAQVQVGGVVQTFRFTVIIPEADDHHGGDNGGGHGGGHGGHH